MEKDQRNKKRAREDDESEGSSFENHNNNSNAKKRDVHGKSFMKEEKVEENECFKGWDSSHLAVFDFPWLKDNGGVISNSEDFFLDFEENFLSFHSSSKIDHHGGIFEECGFYDIPEASTSHVPEDVWEPFEEDNGLELEAAGDLDCIWSSLLNKPI